jgi:hypothetical protein
LRLIRQIACGAAILACARIFAASAGPPPHTVASTQLEAGRYLVITDGCNHCHTQGWQQSNGEIPQSKWLLGGHAPGTGGAATPNLRVITDAMPQSAFIHLVHVPHSAQDQMPWFNLRTLSDADLTSIYVFIKSLK